MNELTEEQFASIPFNNADHDICSRLIRISTDAKVTIFPNAWSQGTAAKPVINIRNKEDGIIIGGILGFYYDDYFVTVNYVRNHIIDRRKYKLNSGDGSMRISSISIGSSPKPDNNLEVTSVRSSKRQWLDFMADWDTVCRRVERNQ